MNPEMVGMRIELMIVVPDEYVWADISDDGDKPCEHIINGLVTERSWIGIVIGVWHPGVAVAQQDDLIVSLDCSRFSQLGCLPGVLLRLRNDMETAPRIATGKSASRHPRWCVGSRPAKCWSLSRQTSCCWMVMVLSSVLATGRSLEGLF